MKTHIEHYRAGYVVCLGEHYGEALSRPFPTKEEAENFRREFEAHMSQKEQERKS